jgi:hypothetical protein
MDSDPTDDPTDVVSSYLLTRKAVKARAVGWYKAEEGKRRPPKKIY